MEITRRELFKMAGIAALGATVGKLSVTEAASVTKNNEGDNFMSSVHIAAKVGEVAERVLLPGDPVRAKNIAENFLTNVHQYTAIRNAFGFTGKYRGVPVSIQATGMGVPSISIYLHELIETYGAKKLIRVGTCGGMNENIRVRDVVIAQGSTTDSSIVKQVFGGAVNFSLLADYELLSRAVNAAKNLNLPVKVGNVMCVDLFYNDYEDPNGTFGDGKNTFNDKLRRYGILAVEMESAALYLQAAAANVQALTICTVSDHLLTKEVTTAEERQSSFNDMIKIALEVAVRAAELPELAGSGNGASK